MKTMKTVVAGFGVVGFSVLLGACTKTGSTDLASQSAKIQSLQSMSAKNIAISGPDIVLIGQSNTYQIIPPSGSLIVSATWTFGDGTAPIQGSTAITHAINPTGLISLTVNAVDTDGVSYVASENINVIGFYDGLQCLPDTTMTYPSTAIVGVPISVQASIPSCFASSVTAVNWNFGDGATATGASAQHTYAVEGDDTIVMQIMSPYSEDGGPFLTITRVIHVSAPTPTPSPTPVASPAPTATPVPTPSPTPNPLACPSDGATRESLIGSSYDQTVACGTNGAKTQTYQVKLVETCSVQGGVLLWTEISRTPVLQSEGACQNQSCRLPDGSLLSDGASRTFYSSQTPSSTCAQASEIRVCHNGALSGSYVQPTCHEACIGFGPHGAVRTGVSTGTTNVPKTCAYGETGVTDTYQQISDQTCTDGQVVTGNTRQGSLIAAGACPTYAWSATDQWGACSADCGGSQQRTYECRDSNGQLASSDRCGVAPQAETRLCDGNPAAVARVETSSAEEEGGSTGLCPANQLGVTVMTRTTTTTKTYACLDHAVKLASTTTASTPWIKESYCRTYTAYRCSQDSLSNTDADGRYKWMLKCQDQVPVIKEFLTEFADVKAKGNYSIGAGSRRVYPTFMNRATNPEKPWIAPKVATASCTVPATAYVAAVCLSSCATPEQEIIAEAKANLKLRQVPFIEALTKNYGFVGTLRSESPMSERVLQKTKVDQWVTELIETDHDILNFRTASGGSLRVTPNHPIVATDGSIKLAENFAVGESLVKFGGTSDRIVAIDHEVYFGKVYNLFVQSAAPQHNVIVTSGFLNGTAFFQNEGATYLNRAILRKNLTRGAVK